MIEMIGAVLNITAIRSGNFSLLSERHSINLMIAELMDSFHLPMAEKKIVFRKDIPDHEVFAMLDRGRIYQVLTNLLSNALKFTPESGEIILQLCGA